MIICTKTFWIVLWGYEISMEKIEQRRIWGLSTAALEPELLSQNLLLGPSPWFSCCTPSGWVKMMGINGFNVEFMGIKIGFYRDFLELRFNWIGDWRWFSSSSALWLAGKSTIYNNLYIYSYSIVIVIIDLPWIWKLSLHFLIGIFNCYVWLPEGLRFFVGGLFLLVLGTHIPKDN